jgi:hypothetical protein
MNLLYAVFGAEAQGLTILMDGNSIMSFFLGCLPTSRGTVTLGSSNPAAPPIIDPNSFATAADKHIMREGFRMQSKVMLDTSEGKNLVLEEHTPPGQAVAGLNATDEQIDERVKLGGSTISHPDGTAAMGKVVDTSLKVYGLKSLRIVDASVVSIIIISVISAWTENKIDPEPNRLPLSGRRVRYRRTGCRYHFEGGF